MRKTYILHTNDGFVCFDRDTFLGWRLSYTSERIDRLIFLRGIQKINNTNDYYTPGKHCTRRFRTYKEFKRMVIPCIRMAFRGTYVAQHQDFPRKLNRDLGFVGFDFDYRRAML